MLQRPTNLSYIYRCPLFFSSSAHSNGRKECYKQSGGSLPTLTNLNNIGIRRTMLGIQYFHSSRCIRENATKNTSGAQPECDLPELELPGAVSYIKRTTALLTQEEAQRYLYPLYRRGWEIKSMVANDGFNDQDRKSPFLVGNLTFKGPKSARNFLQELMAIEEREKHHVSFNLWSEKRPVVTVVTQTHSARKPSLSGSSEMATDYSTEPGITLRDIRLAVLLENYARDSKLAFLPSAGPNEYGTARMQSLSERDTWEEFMSQYPWKPTEK